MARRKAEVVNIRPDINRILAAICYVIDVAERNRFNFTQYDVVKSLFLADRSHLNKFGRLVTSDVYVAMIHGPVPSTAYDLLKQNRTRMKSFGLGDLPWKSHDIGHGRLVFSGADVSLVDGELSFSDKAALDAAVTTINSLSFGQIRKLTHEDPAYIDAWEDDTDRKQFPISLGLLFDTPNFEKAREIMDISKL
jgi:uncharacterized phage-associated protein